MWKQSAPAVAWLTQLRALLAGCTWIRITLPLVNWRVGDLLENNGLGNNRSACVTSILWIEWLQAFDCCCKWWPMRTVESMLLHVDIPGWCRTIWQRLVGLSNPKSVGITNSTQPCGQTASTLWFDEWQTRLRPSTLWECSQATLLTQSSMCTLCKLVQLHCMSQWSVPNNKTARQGSTAHLSL